MTLVEFVEQFESVERSIVVVNRTEPEPLRNMLMDTFVDDTADALDRRNRAEDRAAAGTENVPPTDADVLFVETIVGDDGHGIDPDALRWSDAVAFDGDGLAFDGDSLAGVENLVLVIEDGRVVAAASLMALAEAVLLVNSDLYITGARDLEEIDLPSVVTGLDDTVFTLRGYPESNRQKLLLITISRFIERAAVQAGAGTLRSSFQRLSRIDDEIGTRRAYERVIDAGVDAHLYGVPDDPPDGLDAVVHAGTSVDFTDTWFVVYRPADGPRAVEGGSDLERGARGGVALLAAEVEPRIWRGLWTFDPDRIRRLNGYIERHL